jgi:tRNA pseudouridine32 synthase/23S rRNA pseudouridine746 synthase
MFSREEILAARRIPPLHYNPPTDPLTILYQDEHLLVLSKPCGLLSVPGRGDDVQDSLETRARDAFPEALLVHRLDMDTSGVFVMARDKDTQRNLGLQFERRKTDKIYIARVWGHMIDDEGLVDLPLRCDWDSRPLQMVCDEHGRPSQTKWRVLKRENKGVHPTTLVELSPITGRSHQLRVHLAEIGYPIVDDCFYCPEVTHEFSKRLHLHAHKLTIHHPSDGTRITFTDPVPF